MKSFARIGPSNRSGSSSFSSPGDGALCDGLFASYMVAPDWCAASPINFTVECLACADANDPACAPAR